MQRMESIEITFSDLHNQKVLLKIKLMLLFLFHRHTNLTIKEIYRDIIAVTSDEISLFLEIVIS